MFNAKELSSAQIAQIKEWASEGAQLDDIQKKLKESEDVNLTYMETRFLVLDLEITLQSEVEEVPEEEAEPLEPAEAVAPEETASPLPSAPAQPPAQSAQGSQPASAPHAELTSGVELHVDQVALPESMVSGSVTFSDGEKATWYIDVEGRLGMETVSDSYTPSEAELSSFQSALRQQLEKM